MNVALGLHLALCPSIVPYLRYWYFIMSYDVSKRLIVFEFFYFVHYIIQNFFFFKPNVVMDFQQRKNKGGVRWTKLCSVTKEAIGKNKGRGQKHKKNKRGEGAGRKLFKCERLGLKNVRKLYWNCVSVDQQRLILDKLVDIIAFQETNVGDATIRLHGFPTFYNRVHLGQAILVRENLQASEIHMSKWSCEDLQLQAIMMQTPESFVVVNIHACS